MRPLAPPGLALEALARIGDEARDRGVDVAHRALEGAVGRQADPAPVRQRGDGAARDRREDVVEVALDDVVVGADRVDVAAEGEAGDHVDRVAHQLGLQVERRAAARGALPARAQPVGDREQRRQEGLDVRRVERGHHHPALPRQASSLAKNRPCAKPISRTIRSWLRGPAIVLGPVAQHARDHRVVGDEQQPARPHANANVGP